MIAAQLDDVAEIADYMGCSNTSNNDSYATVAPSDINFVVSSVLSTLGRSPDIQRGVTQIFHKTTAPSESIVVVQAILLAAKQLQRFEIGSVRSALFRNMIQTASSSSLISCCTKLLSPLYKEAAEKRDLLNLISSEDGHFYKVAEARMKVEVANEKLESLICLYRKQLRIHKLDFTSWISLQFLGQLI